MKFRIYTIVISILIFGAGVFLGWDIRGNKIPVGQSVREDSAGYKFINPLLFVRGIDDQVFPEYLPLKKDITRRIDQKIEENKATNVSVYFRDLKGSQWISVNPDETFTPASMLKVVTLVSVLRAAESDPKLLSIPIILEGHDKEIVDRQQMIYQPKDPIRVGNKYTVNELINHLIIESDNVANVALIQVIGNDKVLKVYDDLQLPSPKEVGNSGYTARQYSHLFRALYNGTYLSRSVSEQVLSLLSKTSFNKGIVAAVPEGTTISHKFGVYSSLPVGQKDINNSMYNELHDCGIVYYPDNPYFVCIMTRGKDFLELEEVIRDISSIIWKDIDELNK